MNVRPLTREVSLESTEIDRERGEGWEIREAFKPWRIIEYSKLMKPESHVKLLWLLQSYMAGEEDEKERLVHLLSIYA